jgi:hypothetical protein
LVHRHSKSRHRIITKMPFHIRLNAVIVCFLAVAHGLGGAMLLPDNRPPDNRALVMGVVDQLTHVGGDGILTYVANI